MLAHVIPMFCPECKSLLVSSGGQLKCKKCGYIRKIEEREKIHSTNKRREKEIMIVDDEGEKVKTMPTIQIKCPKCENNLAIWWLRQLRAADESEVRFFRCTKCDHTWRQYD
jgi:DNA-directed RNA polymerase subunit M